MAWLAARAGRVVRVVRYLLAFGLARGGLFAAPILLANLLAPADYGRLEFAQAMAAFAAPVLALGTASAVPLALVTIAPGVAWGAIVLHHVVVFAGIAAVVLAAWALGGGAGLLLALLATGALLLQSLWSVLLRSLGRNEPSLLLDSGLWLVLATSAALTHVAGVSVGARGPLATAALAVYALALAVPLLPVLRRVDFHDARSHYRSTLRTGLSLMAVTVLTMLAVNLGRLAVGSFTTPEVTAEYGALFRATAIPIVVHQVVMVARFRQVFEWPIERVQRTFPWIVGLIISSVILFWGLSGYAPLLLGQAFGRAFEHHRAVGLLVLAQCVPWSAIALNDLAATRQQVAGGVARASVLFFALALPAAAIGAVVTSAGLLGIVATHSALMLGYYAVQSYSLHRHGVSLPATWWLAGSAYALLSLLAFVA
jgi:O-antigen/teichoic acid export membrane protein